MLQKRTFAIAFIIAGVISLLIILFLEDPARPFTVFQSILLYIVSFLPAMGIAMLFDPAPAKAKEAFLKINFYQEK